MAFLPFEIRRFEKARARVMAAGGRHSACSRDVHYRLDHAGGWLEPIGEGRDQVIELRVVGDPWLGVDHTILDQPDDAREIIRQLAAVDDGRMGNTKSSHMESAVQELAE